MFTTEPDPCGFITRAAARQHNHTPVRLISITCLNSSSGKSSTGCRILIPALLINTSSFPYFSMTVSNTRSTSFSCVTSPAIPILSCRVSSAISPATRSQSACVREQMTVFAPACANPIAIDAPNPLDPPVINATFPSNRNKSITCISAILFSITVSMSLLRTASRLRRGQSLCEIPQAAIGGLRSGPLGGVLVPAFEWQSDSNADSSARREY